MISVPWAGIELRLLAVKVLSLKHWTARAILNLKSLVFFGFSTYMTIPSANKEFYFFISNLYTFKIICYLIALSKVFECSVEKDTTVCFPLSSWWALQPFPGFAAVSRVPYSEHTAHVRTHALTSCGRAWRAEPRTARRGLWWSETCQAAFWAGFLMSSMWVALLFWISSDTLCSLTKNLRPLKPTIFLMLFICPVFPFFFFLLFIEIFFHTFILFHLSADRLPFGGGFRGRAEQRLSLPPLTQMW